LGRAEAVPLHALIDAAPDAILGIDPEGSILWMNVQAERLFGYSRAELVGRSVDLLVPESVRDGHRSHREGYLEHPVPRPMGLGMQLAGRRKDGTTFPAEISLSALETDDGVIVSAAVRDVTDRVEAQAERERLESQAERERLQLRLEQSQRLESLGQLAGGVAHDFNNLLGVILNYAAFVNEELEAADVADGTSRWDGVRDDVNQIIRAGERATALTHQLLAFARREVVRPQVLDLNEVIREVEQLLLRSLGEHVTLKTDLEDGIWSVLADPGKIEQVLVNLAVNARDAMPGGGTLTIDTHNVEADDTFASRHPGMAPGRYVRVRVSDTGDGMPVEVRQRAFEPFFTTKTGGDGTGLGLATVYGIISQAEGSVQIYSEPGMGTTISALLPATDQVAPEAVAPLSVEDRGGGETILVVEDEDPLRDVTVRILTGKGYRVHAAANGPEALQLAQGLDGIDLLLTDVVMPKMLGKELAERLTALRPDLTVVFMSGYAQPVLASNGSLDPDVRLIEKPFSAAALLEKVRKALDAAQ
jgi:PAS domain S-box-containing protein